MNALLEYASYMPHGYCLFWQPWLVILFVGSDLLIFVSYALIPVALLMFLRRRPDIRYRGLVALFAAFILLCGIAHLVSMVTLWVPVYPLHGLVKLVTGLVSMLTAVVLIGLVPRLVAIPSPGQLQDANDRLRAEVAAHERTLAELRLAQQSLEEKVAQRTAELTAANEKLSVMSREAVHRGRNLLSVVGSLAQQTARGAEHLDAFLERFMGRLQALSNATAAVVSAPSQASAPFEAITRRQLEPILLTYGDRISLHGPPVEIDAEAARAFGLVLHELATNAVKFGALAAPEGTVALSWRVTDAPGPKEIVLTWNEAGSSPRDPEADDRAVGGFGSLLLTRAVPSMLRGEAVRSFGDGGMRYELRAPLPSSDSPPPEEPAPFPVAEPSAPGRRLDLHGGFAPA